MELEVKVLTLVLHFFFFLKSNLVVWMDSGLVLVDPIKFSPTHFAKKKDLLLQSYTKKRSIDNKIINLE